jgi:TPR repeat protein
LTGAAKSRLLRAAKSRIAMVCRIALPVLSLVFALTAATACFAGLPEGEAAFAQRDWRTALRELKPLAEQGNARAQFLMGGIARFNQDAGREDLAETINWYRKAAAQGLPEAQRELAFVLLNAKPPQTGEAVSLYVAAAQRGDAESQYQLGVLYDRGMGVKPDLAQRQAWWGKAAAQGYAPVLAALAEVARSGDGVPKSDAEAARLYREAANRGSSEASVELARALAAGRGVPRDAVEAWQWYSFAIALAGTGRSSDVLQAERGQLAGAVNPAQRADAESKGRARAATFAKTTAPRAPVGNNPPPVPQKRS